MIIRSWFLKEENKRLTSRRITMPAVRPIWAIALELICGIIKSTLASATVTKGTVISDPTKHESSAQHLFHSMIILATQFHHRQIHRAWSYAALFWRLGHSVHVIPWQGQDRIGVVFRRATDPVLQQIGGKVVAVLEQEDLALVWGEKEISSERDFSNRRKTWGVVWKWKRGVWHDKGLVLVEYVVDNVVVAEELESRTRITIVSVTAGEVEPRVSTVVVLLFDVEREGYRLITTASRYAAVLKPLLYSANVSIRIEA